eukprot:gene10852-2928_t
MEKQVWFVFGGIGTQWDGMGKAFMHIPAFTNAVANFDSTYLLIYPNRALEMPLSRLLQDNWEMEPKNTLQASVGSSFLSTAENGDIKFAAHRSTSDTKEEASSNCESNELKIRLEEARLAVLDMFVAIVGMEICLVDMLVNAGIQPYGCVGHSIGEVACAYSMGCLSLEEAILTLIGLAYCTPMTDAYKLVAVDASPATIFSQGTPTEVVCINSPNSTTVLLPSNEVHTFCSHMVEMDIAAIQVQSNGAVFHSNTLLLECDLQQKLTRFMSQVTLNFEHKRPSTWFSTSQQDKEMCTFGYFVRNIVRTVDFMTAAQRIPDHAIVVELSPHSILGRMLMTCRPELSPPLRVSSMSYSGLHLLKDTLAHITQTIRSNKGFDRCHELIAQIAASK